MMETLASLLAMEGTGALPYEMVRIIMAVIGIALAFGVFEIVCHWIIFKKAGAKGWMALIPVVNTVMEYKLFWKWHYALVLFLSSAVVQIVTSIGDPESSTQIGIVLAMGVLSLLMYVVLNINKSRHFGHDILFATGLCLLPTIFNAVLAFGSAEYQAEAEMVTCAALDEMVMPKDKTK